MITDNKAVISESVKSLGLEQCVVTLRAGLGGQRVTLPVVDSPRLHLVLQGTVYIKLDKGDNAICLQRGDLFLISCHTQFCLLAVNYVAGTGCFALVD